MTVRIVWLARAELELLHLKPSEAEAILDMVERFASTGEGFVRRMLDGSDEYRLYGPRHYAVIARADGVALCPPRNCAVTMASVWSAIPRALAFLLFVACDKPQKAEVAPTSDMATTSATATASVTASASVTTAPLVDAATLPKCTLVHSCGLSHPGLGSSSRTTSIELATCARTYATSSGPWNEQPSPTGQSQTKTTSTKSVLAPIACRQLKDLLTTLTQADARAAQESAKMDSEACSLALTCTGETTPRLQVQRQTTSGPSRVEQVIRSM
jgi:hypothetical protein